MPGAMPFVRTGLDRFARRDAVGPGGPRARSAAVASAAGLAIVLLSVYAGAGRAAGAQGEVEAGERRSFKASVPAGGARDPVTIRGLASTSVLEIAVPGKERRRKTLVRGRSYEVPLKGMAGSEIVFHVRVRSGRVEVTYPSKEDAYVPGPLHPNRPRESFVPKGGEEELGEAGMETPGQTDREVDAPRQKMDWNPPRSHRLRSPTTPTEDAGTVW